MWVIVVNNTSINLSKCLVSRDFHDTFSYQFKYGSRLKIDSGVLSYNGFWSTVPVREKILLNTFFGPADRMGHKFV